jgi:hypothetical protein
MPEGFNSVADLRVVIDANTDKFHSGVQDMRTGLKALQSEGDSSLGGLDKALAFVGDAAVGVRGKVALFTTAVEAGVAIYKQFASEGRVVAESLGVASEFDRLTGTIASLGMTLQDSAVEGFFRLQSGLTATSSEMLGFASSTEVADSGAQEFAATLLNNVSDALDDVRLKLTLWKDDFKNTKDIDEALDTLDKRMMSLNRRIAEMQESGKTTVTSGWFGTDIDALGPLIKEVEELTAAREKLVSQRPFMPGVYEEMGPLQSVLGDNVRRLEQQREALGMGAVAAAAYAAEQDAINKAIATGVPLTEFRLQQIKQEAARVGELTASIEAWKKADSDRKAEEAKAKQIERAQDNVFTGADREIGSLRIRAQTFGMAADAAGRLLFEERMLQQLRASGGAVTDEDIARVKEIGEEWQRYSEQIRASQDELAEFGQFGQTLSQGLGQAFSQWTRGAEMNVETMVANMIAQLAQLAFQASVLEPLFGGGRSGGNGAVGDFLGGLFGGFRENGGPVEAGKAYIVGEKRAELFIPNGSGRIEPNVGGSGGSPVQIVTNIDARGAGPNEVQELKRMMAERDAALPNQVLAVVREGRERGVA